MVDTPAKRTGRELACRPRNGAVPQVRPDVLLEFVRQLVRNTPNADVLWLTLHTTQGLTGATDAEMAALQAAIRQEHREHPQWPKGFFEEF